MRLWMAAATEVLCFYPPSKSQGDIAQLIKQGEVPVEASASFKAAAGNYMSYIMAIQCAASFGVELVVFNMAASYFHDDFGANVVEAGKIAMLCGVRKGVKRCVGSD